MNSASKTLVVLAWLSAGCASTNPSPSAAVGGQPSPITVDWIYGDDSGAITALPRTQWCSDNSMLIGASDGWERLDAAGSARQPALDADAALASLHALLGDEAPAELAWPDSWNGVGTRALYNLADDLFVLELETAKFARLTTTVESETSARFSPDGKKVAFVRANDLFVIDVATGSETRLSTDGSDTLLNGTLSWVYWEEIFGRRDIGYWWSPDSRRIAYLKSDESMVSEVSFVDFKPAVPTVHKQRYPKAGEPNPAVSVAIAALDGETHPVAIDAASYEYIARVQWLPGGAELSVSSMSRDQTRLELWFVQAASGEAERILTEEDPAWVNIHDDLHFLADGERFIWASERSGYNHLYLFNKRGELLNPITQGEWSTRASSGIFWLRSTLAAVDEAADWVYFTALEKSSIERQLYRVHLDGSGQERLSQEDGTHVVTFSPDASMYLDNYSNVSTPPSLRLHQADGNLERELASPRTDLVEELQLRFPKFLTVPARDGFEMPAQLLLPDKLEPGRRYPVIMYVYGGPSAPTVSNSWQRDTFFDQVLLANGYLVFKVDNRSATAISKTLESSILHQLSGDGELDDLVDAARWVKQLDYVDPERVGMWGWSGGGSMTLLCLTRSQEFKAGIAVAALADWNFYDTKWAEFAMKKPADNPEGYELTSFPRHAENLHGRLMLVHGTYDDNVHPQNMWSMVDALVAAGKPFDMMVYPMRKHGIADAPARIHLFNKMVEFWKLYL